MSQQDDQNIDLTEKLKKAQEEAKAQEEKEQANNEESDNLKQELEKMTELAQRAMADFQNYKRRQEEEQGMLIQTANIGLIKALIPVLDNLQRSESDWTDGIKICVNQFKDTLKNAGLEEIQAEGAKFDPDFHEALLQGPGESDMVIEVLEKGYRVGNRVVRHAKVKVGDGRDTASEA